MAATSRVPVAPGGAVAARPARSNQCTAFSSRGAAAAAVPVAAAAPAARRRQRLQLTACHRCLLQPGRQLIPRPQCGSSRGLSSAAALKQSPATEQQSLATPPAPPAPAQAAAQPPAERPQRATEEEQQDSAGVRAALAMLKFYKAAISPLLPPSCRFLPTCSVYSMDAFQRYGVGKGFVLTAWRLLRCTPWGNSGYDPVTWPPPGLEWAFRK